MRNRLTAIALAIWPAFLLSAHADAPVLPAQRPLPAAAVHDIGGFVGERMRVNKNGAIDGLDINHFVGMLERHDTTDWFWIGEQPGKWLESAILTALATRDDALERKARKMLSRMIRAQQPDGYLGITADSARTPAKPLRGMDPYEQYFTLHALMTAYEVLHDDAALAASNKLADYYLSHIGPDKAQFWPSPVRPPDNLNTVVCAQVVWVPPGTRRWPEMFNHSEIAGHTAHYGLEGTLVIDPILRLYQLTGEKRYLEWSQWVVSQIDTWSGWNTFSKLDQVADGTLGMHQLQPYVHSHTFHMNFLGLLRLYQITGDASLLRKMEGAWSDIVARQLYITGGVSVGEHYEPGYNRPLEGSVVETCANMSWLQFNQALLELTGKPRYADTIEKLLVNHVFAAQTVDGECNRYHTAPNGAKPEGYFHGPDCCTSSGQRQISMIPGWVYAQSADTILVNQFVPSTAEFELGDRHITLVQETSYPEGERVTIRVDAATPAAFTLKIRLPLWCGIPRLTVNGRPAGDSTPGTYQELTRTWRAGDVVELQLPMTTALVRHDHFPGPDVPLALTRGPVVYAIDTVWWDATMPAPPPNIARGAAIVSGASPQPEPTGPRSIGPFYKLNVRLADLPPDAPPVAARFVPFSNVGRWYRDGEPQPDRNSRAFSYAVWLADADAKDFRSYAAERARIRDFGKDAVDYLLPGEASEAEHELVANDSNTGPFNERTYRHGQSFSYRLSVPRDGIAMLLVTYWGGEPNERRFDVLVNDRKLASERLFNNKPGEFFEAAYDIPADLRVENTAKDGKQVTKVTVKFVAAPGGLAGGVFGIRVVKR